MAGALLDEDLAGAGEVAKLADRGGGHEAGAHETVLEELRDPHAILHVGLAAGPLGDLRGVGEDTGERVFQDIVPTSIITGTFNASMTPNSG